MTAPGTTVLETTGYRAPLAVRAIDAATGAAIGDGLIVRAWPAGDPGAARVARPSPFSPLYGFATLPGLRRQEYAKASGSTVPTWPATEALPFVVEVTDTFGRYLPQTLTLTVPRATPSPARLYSEPARPHPPGWAVVTGEVATAAGGRAAWALVEVSDGGTAYRTTTDTAGRFLLCLPYPEALPALAGNPPAGGGIDVVTWPMDVKVRFQPSALQLPAPAGPPDIASIEVQASAQLVTGGGPQPSIVATLRYGFPLSLRLKVNPA